MAWLRAVVEGAGFVLFISTAFAASDLAQAVLRGA